MENKIEETSVFFYYLIAEYNVAAILTTENKTDIVDMRKFSAEPNLEDSVRDLFGST